MTDKQPSLTAVFIDFITLYKITGSMLHRVSALETWKGFMTVDGVSKLQQTVEALDQELTQWIEDLAVIFKSGSGSIRTPCWNPRSVRSTRSNTCFNSPYLSGARGQSTNSASPEPSSGAYPRLPSIGCSGQPAFGQSSLVQPSSTCSTIIQPPTMTFGQTANIQAHATSSSRETRVPSSSGLSAGGFTQYQSQAQSFLPPSAYTAS